MVGPLGRGRSSTPISAPKSMMPISTPNYAASANYAASIANNAYTFPSAMSGIVSNLSNQIAGMMSIISKQQESISKNLATKLSDFAVTINNGIETARINANAIGIASGKNVVLATADLTKLLERTSIKLDANSQKILDIITKDVLTKIVNNNTQATEKLAATTTKYIENLNTLNLTKLAKTTGIIEDTLRKQQETVRAMLVDIGGNAIDTIKTTSTIQLSTLGNVGAIVTQVKADGKTLVIDTITQEASKIPSGGLVYKVSNIKASRPEMYQKLLSAGAIDKNTDYVQARGDTFSTYLKDLTENPMRSKITPTFAPTMITKKETTEFTTLEPAKPVKSMMPETTPVSMIPKIEFKRPPVLTVTIDDKDKEKLIPKLVEATSGGGPGKYNVVTRDAEGHTSFIPVGTQQEALDQSKASLGAGAVTVDIYRVSDMGAIQKLAIDKDGRTVGFTITSPVTDKTKLTPISETSSGVISAPPTLAEPQLGEGWGTFTEGGKTYDAHSGVEIKTTSQGKILELKKGTPVSKQLFDSGLTLDKVSTAYNTLKDRGMLNAAGTLKNDIKFTTKEQRIGTALAEMYGPNVVLTTKSVKPTVKASWDLGETLSGIGEALGLSGDNKSAQEAAEVTVGQSSGSFTASETPTAKSIPVSEIASESQRESASHGASDDGGSDYTPTKKETKQTSATQKAPPMSTTDLIKAIEAEVAANPRKLQLASLGTMTSETIKQTYFGIPGLDENNPLNKAIRYAQETFYDTTFQGLAKEGAVTQWKATATLGRADPTFTQQYGSTTPVTFTQITQGFKLTPNGETRLQNVIADKKAGKIVNEKDDALAYTWATDNDIKNFDPNILARDLNNWSNTRISKAIGGEQGIDSLFKNPKVVATFSDPQKQRELFAGQDWEKLLGGARAILNTQVIEGDPISNAIIFVAGGGVVGELGWGVSKIAGKSLPLLSKTLDEIKAANIALPLTPGTVSDALAKRGIETAKTYDLSIVTLPTWIKADEVIKAADMTNPITAQKVMTKIATYTPDIKTAAAEVVSWRGITPDGKVITDTTIKDFMANAAQVSGKPNSYVAKLQVAVENALAPSVETKLAEAVTERPLVAATTLQPSVATGFKADRLDITNIGIPEWKATKIMNTSGTKLEKVTRTKAELLPPGATKTTELQIKTPTNLNELVAITDERELVALSNTLNLDKQIIKNTQEQAKTLISRGKNELSDIMSPAMTTRFETGPRFIIVQQASVIEPGAIRQIKTLEDIAALSDAEITTISTKTKLPVDELNVYRDRATDSLKASKAEETRIEEFVTRPGDKTPELEKGWQQLGGVTKSQDEFMKGYSGQMRPTEEQTIRRALSTGKMSPADEVTISEALVRIDSSGLALEEFDTIFTRSKSAGKQAIWKEADILSATKPKTVTETMPLTNVEFKTALSNANINPEAAVRAINAVDPAKIGREALADTPLGTLDKTRLFGADPKIVDALKAKRAEFVTQEIANRGDIEKQIITKMDSGKTLTRDEYALLWNAENKQLGIDLFEAKGRSLFREVAEEALQRGDFAELTKLKREITDEVIACRARGVC